MAGSKRMVKKTVWLSHSDAELIDKGADKLGLPVSRVVALLVNDGLKHNPEMEYNFELPSEYVEYAFAAEAGRILDYMKKNVQGLGLDMLYVLRRDMDIEDKDVLLAAFRELIEKGFLTKSEPPKYKYFQHKSDYEYYTIPKDEKQLKEERDYQRFLKLQKKFGKGETE